MSLRKLITTRSLRSKAGGTTYSRGEDYYNEDRVAVVSSSDQAITASVSGQDRYRVKLWIQDGQLKGDCDCPIGADGDFCKHCVAVGLTFLNDDVETTDGEPSQSLEQNIKQYLQLQTKEALIDLLVEQSQRDESLNRILTLKATKKPSKGIDVATFRRTISQTVRVRGFIEYREMRAYVHEVYSIVESLQELLDSGHATEVLELCEHALTEVETALCSVDDSNGGLGGVLCDLQEIFFDACEEVKPDPIWLARTLFERELNTDFDIFYGSAKTYSHLLGDDGLKTYRSLAEEEWRKVQPLKPEEKDPEKYSKRFRITHMMETLAENSGNLEELVAIKAKDLSYAYSFLKIAELYKNAGDAEQALAWAERGAKSFPKNTDSRLREFLANEYHERGKHWEAMQLVWAQFEDRPSLENYNNLKDHSAKDKSWDRWREQALSLHRKLIEADSSKARKRPWFYCRDGSSIVEIFLWEKNPEQAWTEAMQLGCSRQLWMPLAKARETSAPADVIPIYQKELEATISEKNNSAYERGVELLKSIKKAMLQVNGQSAFDQYLSTVKVAHKPKRNFMKLVDKIFQ